MCCHSLNFIDVNAQQPLLYIFQFQFNNDGTTLMHVCV